MRQNEAKKLKVGDRVVFRTTLASADDGSQGVVTEHDYARFMVEWDDGLKCSYLHHLAMAIHRAA